MSQADFKLKIETYLAQLAKTDSDKLTEVEFEVKFNTNLTRYDYNNVTKRLVQENFAKNVVLAQADHTAVESLASMELDEEGEDAKDASATKKHDTTVVASALVSSSSPHLLRVFSKDAPNVRVQLNSYEDIMAYRYSASKEEGVSILKERGFCVLKKRIQEDLVFKEYGFRVSFSSEEKKSNEEMVGLDGKKAFRYLNRVSLYHAKYPFRIDLSTVQQSKRRLDKSYEMHDTILAANVFNNARVYEIEIECLNEQVLAGHYTADKLHQAFKTVILFVVGALQQSAFPLPASEQERVLQEYQRLILPQQEQQQHKQQQQHNTVPFIGPDSYTLELKNIVNPRLQELSSSNATTNVPNIRSMPYAVTDKADGLRNLLFINDKGRIYFIDSVLKVRLTGALTLNKTYFNTILDGELITNTKLGYPLFAAFDVYFVNSHDVRDLPLALAAYTRLNALNEVVSFLKPVMNADPLKEAPFKLVAKAFSYVVPDLENVTSIFDMCLETFNRMALNDLYLTDGLIFTPIPLGVKANVVKDQTPHQHRNKRWSHSFKWKPEDQNTLDFQVETVANDASFVTLALKVGQYNEEKRRYEKVPFAPTNPYDPTAHMCRLPIDQMATDEVVPDKFYDGDVVEFAYDMRSEDVSEWAWVPKRVRHEKKEKGPNNVVTANGNWHTLHYPVTKAMLTNEKLVRGLILPPTKVKDTYYPDDDTPAANNNISTERLRTFHNAVKSLLITGVAQLVKSEKKTLIDLAVGKAGDLHKWDQGAKLSFVLGLDIVEDNLTNLKNGAKVRYQHLPPMNRNALQTLFVVGDARKNIASGQGIPNKKEQMLVQAVFQDTDAIRLQACRLNLMPDLIGIAKDGFDLCSMQFALHYMFESVETVQSFLQNVVEVTKVGGYFFGTCYDGESVFNKLKKQEKMTYVLPSGQEVWRITKQYDAQMKELVADETCVGLKLDVFQESIGGHSEYLVNFAYLTKELVKRGFEEVTTPIKDLAPTGQFADQYKLMRNNTLSAKEQEMSALNRFFIYKRIIPVSPVEKVEDESVPKEPVAEQEDQANLEEESVAEQEEPVKKEEPVLEEEPVAVVKDDEMAPIKEAAVPPVLEMKRKTKKAKIN